MASQRPLRDKVGVIKKAGAGTDWLIPIYGVDTMDFYRETVWDLKSTITAPLVASWQGDKPVEFDFKFKLVAGVGVPTREKLFDYVKIAHALNAGSYNLGGAPTPPPACIFILGSYVACRGILANIRVSVNAPWGGGVTNVVETDEVDISSSYDGMGLQTNITVESIAPTSAVFSGRFIPLPGWNGKGNQIVRVDTELFSSGRIRDSFYRSSEISS